MWDLAMPRDGSSSGQSRGQQQPRAQTSNGSEQGPALPTAGVCPGLPQLEGSWPQLILMQQHTAPSHTYYGTSLERI